MEKFIFFAPQTLLDPPLALTVRGPGCPPAPPSDHWYRGLGVNGQNRKVTCLLACC